MPPEIYRIHPARSRSSEKAGIFHKLARAWTAWSAGRRKRRLLRAIPDELLMDVLADDEVRAREENRRHSILDGPPLR